MGSIMGAVKSDTRSLDYIAHIGPEPYCGAGILGTLKSIYGQRLKDP